MQDGTRAQMTIAKPIPANPAAVDAHYKAVDEALDFLNELSDKQAELVAQVLVDVPREWLIAGSPELIDWSDFRSLDFVQEPRYADILEFIRSGEARRMNERAEAQKAAKN